MEQCGPTNSSAIRANSRESVHPIFQHDPKKWMDLLHSEVSVVMNDGRRLCGFVYTVDPVSQSLVLIHFAGGAVTEANASLTIVMEDAVDSVSVLNKDSDDIVQLFDRMFRPLSETSMSQEELAERKENVKSWMEKHRFPVSVDKDGVGLTIAGALTIRPPYTEDSCLSTNEIILSRIQGLLKSMPQDVSNWDI